MTKRIGIIAILILALLPLEFVSSLNISYFYSPTCQHCNEVRGYINSLKDNFSGDTWKFYNVLRGSYNVVAVPTIKIKTEDCRDIELVGTKEIRRYLKCELQQMSTMDCPTNIELNRGSYFIE